MDEFAADVGRWAGVQEDVRAVGLVGSYARGTASPDSDIDLIVVVDDLGSRLTSRAWLDDFGEVADVEHEDWGLVQSLRVHFRDGPEVEFGLAPWSGPELRSRLCRPTSFGTGYERCSIRTDCSRTSSRQCSGPRRRPRTVSTSTGFIGDPKSKAKSVLLTDEGAHRAEQLFNELFGMEDAETG